MGNNPVDEKLIPKSKYLSIYVFTQNIHVFTVPENKKKLFSRSHLVRSRLCYSVAAVCLSSVVCDVRIVAKRCVLEQKLQLRAYIGSLTA